MIEAIQLSKRSADGGLALDALNLEVAPGEVYCLLGAQGAGKTTTLNLLVGFLQPTSGRARIAGVDVARDLLEARRHLAYLPKGLTLYGSLSILRNLDFLTRLGGRRESRAGYYRALRRAGLPEAAFNRPLRELSPGMRTKLGLAAVALKGSPAVLLDEPFSDLDPKASAEIAELLGELRDDGRAILLTTYDLFWARQLADRIGILQEGRLVLARTREELRYEPLDRLYLDYMRGDLVSTSSNSDDSSPASADRPY